MINKILRANLWILFALAFLNGVYYCFSKSFPDHSLVISSSDNDVSYISYYFTSLFSVSSYYVGAWIIAPFVTYFFIYFTLLNKREKEFDLFLPFLLCGFFFSNSYMFFPEFIGQGLLYRTNNVLDTYIVFGMSLIFGFFVALITMRGAFWDTLKTIQAQLSEFGRNCARLAHGLYNRASEVVNNLLGKAQSGKVKLGAIKLLKEGLSRGKDKDIKSVSYQREANQPISKTSYTPPGTEKVEPTKPEASVISKLGQIVKPSEKKDSVDTVGTATQNQKVKQPESNTNKEGVTELQSAPKASNTGGGQETFFQSEELIDCISDKTNHERVQGPDKDYFDTICNTIESKLNEFNVKGQIINILKGPVVDTFELDLGEGIKASKVKGLEDDIGLALNGAPIRVVYPLKGRSTIGIEVPRNPREFIYLDELLQNQIFNESNNRLPIAMGKDAFGEVAVVDLAGMPHMLVAGATGAGKSVFINTLLVSLIIKKSPKELKLVLIDPKQLELALFSTLPHLMLPVITEAKSAAVSLLWAVEEMERRYTILKEMGVKNIEGFNKKVKAAGPSVLWKISQYYENCDEDGYELPYIVIVIDEFADLILTKSGKDIEINVNRLAAKARAAGIHLVLATQRPSTDVITGVIKANFPTRVAFRVTTGHDSKTILDQYGAQKLLGKGDMLYKHGVELLRLHGSFVDEGEIEVLVEKLSEIPSEFNEEAIKFLETGGEEEDSEANGEVSAGGTYVSGTSDDPVYQEALQVVMESGQASASMLQRRLRVGYNRAANIIDELERNGIVGPAQGSKPRKVMARPD
ncbi:MAG: hypothetical protein KC478_05555 [Bacteriovoracaceae bacterium]|nr:hypothetical protein [Bacteriovoracaceae bacterium]